MTCKKHRYCALTIYSKSLNKYILNPCYVCSCMYVCMCTHVHTYTINDVYVSIILAKLRNQTSSQPPTDRYIIKLVLDEILCYIFNYTDVTGQTVTEPQAAPTLLMVIANRNISIW